MKFFATSLLVLAAIIFIFARWFEDDYRWLEFVRATAEAAMVGALADWFAVTALFKHPMGIPIPHTAIIRERKDQIGGELGRFVQSNFLSASVVSEKLERVDAAQRIGLWLKEPHNARTVVNEAAVVAATVSEAVSDDARKMTQTLVHDRLGRLPVAPVIGRVIDAGMDGDHHHEVYNAVLKGAANFLEDNRATFRRRLINESPWWVPEGVDDKVFEKIYGAVMTFLREVDGDPDHHVRGDIDSRSREFADRLRSDDRLIDRGEQLKHELPDHPEFESWSKDLWSSLQAGFGAAAGNSDSAIHRRLEEAVVALGQRLVADEELQRKLNEWIESTVVALADAGGPQIGALIADTVRGWDADELIERIEPPIGSDLQFIRINGTLVGGLAGFIIFAVSEWFF